LSKSLPYLALCLGILVLSMSTIFVRWAEAPALVTSFYRMAIATLILAPFFWYRVAASPAPGNGAGSVAPRRAYHPAMLAGVLAALDHATLSTAVLWTSVANATLLNNLAPVWVALLAVVVWRQRLGGRFWLGLLLACAGAAVVLGQVWLHPPAITAAGRSVDGNASIQWGDWLGLLSSFFYALYLLAAERARQGLDTLSYLWPMVGTATLVLLAGNLLLGHGLTGYPLTTYAIFCAAGLVSQVVGYSSVSYALGHLPAAVVGTTLIAQPVVTALLAIPLAGESLSAWQVLGGLGVLGGIWWVVRSQAEESDEPGAG
jgi:drug/metabolite transporter (DMT)-like permease